MIHAPSGWQWIKKHRSGVGLWAGVLGMTLGTGWVAWLFWTAMVRSGVLRYADTSLPMLTTPDAYYFLYNTKEMLRLGVTLDAETSLSAVLAMLHRVVWLPPEVTGFWLPPLLAVLSGLCFGLWGRLFRLPLLWVGVAALVGSLLPAWTSRVRAGALDTDAGIFLLWGLCLWIAARLTLPHSRLSFGNLTSLAVGYVLCAALLGWFWQPGLLLVPLTVWLWGLTWGWASTALERKARMVVAAIVPLVVALGLIAPESLLPLTVADTRARLLAHLGMLFNPHDAVLFQSIAELAGQTWSAWLAALGGNLWGGGLVLAAIAAMTWRYPRQSLLLTPSLFMGWLGLYSSQYQYLMMLPAGLAVGMLPVTLPVLLRRALRQRKRFSSPLTVAVTLPIEIRWKNPTPTVAKKQHPFRAARLTALVLMGFLGWSLVTAQLARPGGAFLSRGEDEIALALREASNAKPFGETRALFHWWDEGYYLRYRTGLSAFFDGKSQDALSAFLAALPFVTDNPDLSRRWIRYFALHPGRLGLEAWEPLVRAWGSDEAALRELTTLFSLPAADIPAHLATWPLMPGLADDLSAHDWLFPEGAVFLYLPMRFLELSPWWMAMGSGLKPGPVQLHAERFARAALGYDPQTNRVSLPPEIARKGYSQAGGLFLASPQQPFVEPWGADLPEPLLVAAEHSPWGYLVNRRLARSVGFRLLAPSWESLPGFYMIAVNFGTAGAWEILP